MKNKNAVHKEVENKQQEDSGRLCGEATLEAKTEAGRSLQQLLWTLWPYSRACTH